MSARTWTNSFEEILVDINGSHFSNGLDGAVRVQPLRQCPVLARVASDIDLKRKALNTNVCSKK